MIAARAASLLAAALECADRLGPVFPLHSRGDGPSGCDCRKDCGRNAAKHPRTAHGLNDATTDRATIRRWWGMWPLANIGLATGPASGLLVIDIDRRHSGHNALMALMEQHGKLPRTWRVRTLSGGWHLYFRYPGGLDIRNSAGTVLGPGLDVRATAGYVVVPPSVGANGEPYVWEVGPWS
jgi:putative DNA primase/helicase